MRALLERAGFRIRSPKRADCAHCKGHSTGTVSYTDTVAYCHRCQWRASARQLRAELDGLKQPRVGADLRGRPPGPQKGQTHRSAPTKRHKAEALLEAFRTWFDWTLLLIGHRERQLFWAKRKVTRRRRENPANDSMWDEIIRITEEENHLEELWEFVTCDPLPRWLAEPTTIEEVFRFWQTRCRGTHPREAA